MTTIRIEGDGFVCEWTALPGVRACEEQRALVTRRTPDPLDRGPPDA